MKSHLPAKAFIGYGHDSKTGAFFIKICDKCNDCESAKKEFNLLAIRIQPCTVHYNEVLEKQIK
jgi:hypothetical protein